MCVFQLAQRSIVNWGRFRLNVQIKLSNMGLWINAKLHKICGNDGFFGGLVWKWLCWRGRGGAEKVQGESVGWWSEGERGVGRNENSVGNQYPRHFVSSSAPFSALLLSPCVQIYINKMLMSKCRSFFQFISLWFSFFFVCVFLPRKR